MKQNVKKMRILILSLFFSTAVTVQAATTFQQTIITTVPAAANVTTINPAQAMGVIDPPTGNTTSPSAGFRLQTNGTDNDYTYTVQAKVHTLDANDMNAYALIASQPYILLGSNATVLYPTAQAVANIKSGSPTPSLNQNVIAYSVTNTLNNLSSATFTTNPSCDGLCFVVKAGTCQDGTLTQKVGVNPLSGTYSMKDDKPGVYQAYITFSANRKP